MAGFKLFQALAEEARKDLNAVALGIRKAEREEYEISVLKVIDEAVNEGRFKQALSVIEIYQKRYPRSPVMPQVSSLKADLLQYKKAMAGIRR